MPHGQHGAPVQMRERRYDQDPSPVGLPEPLLPGALHPAARWVCRPVASSDVDAGLECRGAREFTGQILRGWGLPMLAEDAAVIVSELVTNALLHGCGLSTATAGRVELILWRQDGQMVCAVTDPGLEPPVLVTPDPLAEAGRGLQVVEALSAAWGWTRLGGCRKAVWAALAVPGDEGAAGWNGPPARSAIV